jgi:hypothetical protein
MIAVRSFACNQQPDIYFCTWKKDHLPLFDVKIPHGFEFLANDVFNSFSTSF